MMRLLPYEPSHAEAWDTFCGAAHQATFLHTRRFLSYHGDRFIDRSLIIEKDDQWIGLLPAAEHPKDKRLVVSHPGITYGGLLHQGKLRGEAMVEALTLITRHYATQGYETLLYKSVPTVYHRVPAQDDSYALFRLGAVRARCDLSSAIDLEHRADMSERRRRSLKKAQKSGVEVAAGTEHFEALWTVLSENLQREHGATPVHSLAEILLLAEYFPNNIRCVVAMHEERVVAGVVLFLTATAAHAQYIAANEAGYELSALDAVFDACITSAQAEGRRWFDFGISNEQGGRVLNEGLYAFKSEFGGGGVAHEFFELELGVGHGA